MSRTRFQFGQMVECSFKNQVVLGSSPVAVTMYVVYLITVSYGNFSNFWNNMELKLENKFRMAWHCCLFFKSLGSDLKLTLQTYHLTVKACCGLRNINKIALLELSRFTVQSWHHIKVSYWKRWKTDHDEEQHVIRRTNRKQKKLSNHDGIHNDTIIHPVISWHIT